MMAVDLDEQEQTRAGSIRKPWRTPCVTRFEAAGAEAGDSGGGPDGDTTKS